MPASASGPAMRFSTARNARTAVNNPKPPPPARQKQFAIGGRHLIDIAPVHIAHDEHARLRGIIERRSETRALRRLRADDARRCALPRSPNRPRLPHSRNVAEVMSAPCAGASTSRRQRNGGIDPVPVQSHIAVAPVFALDLEPVDEFLARRIVFQRIEHRDPCGQDDASPAAPSRAPPPRCARAERFRVRLALSSSCLRNACESRSSGTATRFNARAQIARRFQQFAAKRFGIRFQRIERFAVFAARTHMVVGSARNTSPAPRGARP